MQEVQSQARSLPARLTPQRQAVYDALRMSHDHPTAADLYERARHRYPGISFATVYNSLRFLKDHGLALELPMTQGPNRFDGTTEDHGHIHCEGCGALADLPNLPMDAPDIPGWAVSQVQITISGWCPDCRGRAG